MSAGFSETQLPEPTGSEQTHDDSVVRENDREIVEAITYTRPMVARDLVDKDRIAVLEADNERLWRLVLKLAGAE